MGSIFLARVPDLFGRRNPMLLSLLAQIPCYLGIILSRSLILTTVFGFFFGLTNVGIYNGAYVNVCEYVHTFWKNHVCTFLLVFDQLTVVFIALYWKYISKDWVWFQVVGLIILCLATVGSYFLPESPEYLYCFYRFEECREVLAKIGKWNKKDKELPKVY